MTEKTLPRVSVLTALLIAAMLFLTACSEYRAPGELGENQQILDECPNQKLNTYIQVDGTSSGRSPETDANRLEIIERLARETAICSGRFTVVGYSASSGAAVKIYDSEIALPGATDNARLRRTSEAVKNMMSAITGTYDEALAQLPEGGSDIAGMLRLAAEQQAQVGDRYLLRYVNLTDGLDNVGVALGEGLSPEQATALADEVTVPALPGAEVTFAGIGRVAGDPVSSAFTESLIAFYQRLCERTEAGSCLVVTDWR